MQNVVTVILAAGESRRIKSSKSKIFHEISERPLIEYVYSIAEKISPKDVVFVSNKKNYNFLTKRYDKAKIVLQKSPRGTADAVFCAKKKIPKKNDILILLGDVPLVKQRSILHLIKKYRFSKKVGCLLVFNSND